MHINFNVKASFLHDLKKCIDLYDILSIYTIDEKPAKTLKYVIAYKILFNDNWKSLHYKASKRISISVLFVVCMSKRMYIDANYLMNRYGNKFFGGAYGNNTGQEKKHSYYNLYPFPAIKK